jgi:ketosteroid isomerase-like protein
LMHPNEALVRAFYESRILGDRKRVRSLLTEDIRWHDPYPPPFGGDFEGVEAVLEFLMGTLVEEMEDSGIVLHDVVAGDHHTVSLVEWWAVLDGRRMDGHEVGVFHVRGTRIAEAWFMTEDRRASDAFFSR